MSHSSTGEFTHAEDGVLFDGLLRPEQQRVRSGNLVSFEDRGTRENKSRGSSSGAAATYDWDDGLARCSMECQELFATISSRESLGTFAHECSA